MKANGSMPASPSPVPKRLRILCVDDEITIRKVLAVTLRRADHVCEVAADGREALQTISANTEAFDLIVTDNDMPGMNGLAFVESLRGAGFTGRVVVHSSPLSAPILAAYRSLRVDAFVEKPADTDTLLRAIGN